MLILGVKRGNWEGVEYLCFDIVRHFLTFSTVLPCTIQFLKMWGKGVEHALTLEQGLLEKNIHFDDIIVTISENGFKYIVHLN